MSDQFRPAPPGVVSKTVTRLDGSSEESHYAIGPRRSSHAEAVEDLRLLTGTLVKVSDELRQHLAAAAAVEGEDR